MIVIIPARKGSQGIPGKNHTKLAGGKTPTERAVGVAIRLGLEPIVSSDGTLYECWHDRSPLPALWLESKAPLHNDTCPMIDVVKDVLDRMPGEPDETVVLLQPTQPLRLPSDVLRAIFMLEDDPELDCVFSVVPVPSAYHADVQIIGGRDTPPFPTRRQDLPQAFCRDGTVYAFRRKTVEQFGTIYGQKARFFVVEPENSCFLDTPADWTEAERRIREKLVVAPHSPVNSR